MPQHSLAAGCPQIGQLHIYTIPPEHNGLSLVRRRRQGVVKGASQRRVRAHCTLALYAGLFAQNTSSLNSKDLGNKGVARFSFQGLDLATPWCQQESQHRVPCRRPSDSPRARAQEARGFLPHVGYKRSESLLLLQTCKACGASQLSSVRCWHGSSRILMRLPPAPLPRPLRQRALVHQALRPWRRSASSCREVRVSAPPAGEERHSVPDLRMTESLRLWLPTQDLTLQTSCRRASCPPSTLCTLQTGR